MKNVNEEDYLDSLLKSMNNKVEESDDDKEERLLKEQIKEAVQKTHLQQDEKILDYYESDVPENNSEHTDGTGGLDNTEVVTDQGSIAEPSGADNEAFDDNIEPSGSKAEADIATEPSNDVAQIMDNVPAQEPHMDLAAESVVESSDPTDKNDNIPVELGEEYSHLFEPESDDFKISDIPDRDPEELSVSEIERLANMDLDEFLSGNEDESMSIDDLFGSASASQAKTDSSAATIDGLTKTGEDKSPDIVGLAGETIESVLSGSDSLGQAGLAGASAMAGAAGAVGSALGALGGLAGEISSESAAVAAAAASAIGEAGSAGDKKKAKKEKKSKNKKNTESVSKNKKSGKKFNLLEFIKNIFFEEIEDPKDTSEKALKEPKDENERVLRELYGNTTDTEYDEDVQEPKGKKGFFSKKGKNKAETVPEEDDYDEQDELERQNRKKAKKEKKAADKAKKKEAAQAKKEKKPPKEKKAPKPKKPKKQKPPTRPQDMIKIKPGAVILLIMFVSGVVVFVQISNNAFQYQNAVSKATLYFQSGNYEKSYEYLQGIEVKETDKQLYDQVVTIMYLDKHYLSYQHYVELGMGVEALDSLVKGVSRYYEFYNKAKELGVADQYDAIRAELVDALKTTFAISEAKAISYAALADADFVQYYYTLESYGGMINNDSNN